MGWNGSAAGTGAASGAAAGAALGPWGALAGGVIGGLASGFGGSGQELPKPVQAPGPGNIGGVMTDTGGMYRDPYTGLITQTNFNFDPSGMGANLDAETMWNQFMGRDNSSQVNDLDWQIKQLTQNLERMQKSGGGTATNPETKQKMLGDNALLISDDGQIDNAAVQKYSQKFAGNPFFEAFLSQTGGNYGGGYEGWFKEHINGNLKTAAETYKKDVASGAGNSEVNAKAVQDLQNQIQYLTSQRDRVAGASASDNPLSRFTSDIGTRWEGRDNTNPYTDAWGDVTAKKIAGINDDPLDVMKKFGIGGEGDGYSGDIKALIDKAGDWERIDPNRLQAPELDASQAARLKDSMNWQAAQEFGNQATARDALAARRGLLNSSVSDMQRTGDIAGLVGSQKDAALKAAQLRDQLINTNFGQQATANSAYQNAISGNNAAANAARGFQLTGLGKLSDDAARNYGLYLNAGNQSFAQAMAALENANKMRSEDRSFDIQDYTFGRNENDTEYSRANDMWNRLNALRQQGVTNKLNQSQANLAATTSLSPINMQYVNMQNQVGAANAQNQNAFNMGGAQLAAAGQQGQLNALTGLAGSALGAMGSYYGAQGQAPTIAPQTQTVRMNSTTPNLSTPPTYDYNNLFPK